MTHGVPYGTLGNLRGGTEECHMALLGWKGLNEMRNLVLSFIGSERTASS